MRTKYKSANICIDDIEYKHGIYEHGMQKEKSFARRKKKAQHEMMGSAHLSLKIICAGMFPLGCITADNPMVFGENM